MYQSTGKQPGGDGVEEVEGLLDVPFILPEENKHKAQTRRECK